LQKNQTARLSAKLAVLAAAAVDPGLPPLTVADRLAGDARPAGRQGVAPGVRNALAAVFAKFSAGAFGQAKPRKLYGVGNRVVDLLLYGAVARPTIRHLIYLGHVVARQSEIVSSSIAAE
jgi:hypothetical protein